MTNNDKGVSKRAVFSFEDYKFTNFSVSLGKLREEETLGLDFDPSGEYDSNTGLFKLTLNFAALSEVSRRPVIASECVALFKFDTPLPIAEVPEYFFANATAILYPYIRAFVSTLTVQANYPSFVLPTLNVSLLGEKLKSLTVEKEVSAKIG